MISLISFRENNKIKFSMTMRNGELVLECFLKHSRMGTARMKQDKEKEEEGKKRGASMKRSKASKKKSRRPITT